MDKKEIEEKATQLVQYIEQGSEERASEALHNDISAEDRYALARAMDRINQVNRRANPQLPDIRYTTTHAGGQVKIQQLVFDSIYGSTYEVYLDQAESKKICERHDWNDGNLTGVSHANRLHNLALQHDDLGTQSIMRDGKLILERVTRPNEKDGECIWRINQNKQVRGSIQFHSDGSLSFVVSNGDRYLFSHSGTIEHQRAEPPQPSFTPAKVIQWTKENLSTLDSDKNGVLSTDELWQAGRRANTSGYDACMIATLLTLSQMTFGDLSASEVSKLIDDPITKQSAEKIIARFAERALTTDPRIWGAFGNSLDAISPEAIEQGMLGDCWLLGSIAAVAEYNPALIKEMITANQNGSFTVNFPGHKEPITVDPPNPLELALYARSNRYGTWVAVLEKAAAAISNKDSENDRDRNSLDGGFGYKALELLTGKKAISCGPALANNHPELCTKAESLERLSSILTVAQQWHQPVVASSDSKAGSDGSNVYALHLYTVLAYDPATKTVTLRNPWGFGEAVNANGTARDGAQDGKFTLSLDAFARNFSSITAVVP